MPRVKVVRGARKGLTVDLQDREAVIGRSPDARIRLDPEADRLVSAEHAVVTRTHLGWTLRDLGSRNGTRVNGEPLVGLRVLEHGDRIELGATGPVLVFEEDAGASTADPIPPGARRATSGRGRWIATAVGLGAAALALSIILGRRSPPPPSRADDPPAASPERTAGTAGASDPSAPAPDPGPGARSSDQELEGLREEVAGLAEALRRSRQEADSLRSALERAEASGADLDEVARLRRELQAAGSALLRQQLAATLDFDDLRARIRAATAQVYVEFADGRVVAATAFGVHPSGSVLTSRHVVRDSADRAPTRIVVQFAGSTRLLPASVRAVDNVDDLALLEVEAPGPIHAVAAFNRRPDTLRSGVAVAAFGFPLGGDPAAGAAGTSAAEPLITAGILASPVGSGLMEVQGYGAEGASGSPLVDAAGEVVGVVVGGTVRGSNRTLFAVPSHRIVPFVERWAGSGGG